MSSAILPSPSSPESLVLERFDGLQEEQRIVMFIDLVGSTSIAERFGSVRFYRLLSDVFEKLSDILAGFGGNVHRTVGDAMIVTWSIGTCQENARPIRAVFACRDALELAEPIFRREYGHAPRFRASLHCGPLVAATMGGFKGDIALVGDAMNTAARIEQECQVTGHGILLSRSLMARTAIPVDVVATSIGTRVLRGKAERLELFALKRRVTACAPVGVFQACA
jgi:adenylate cyclase